MTPPTDRDDRDDRDDRGAGDGRDGTVRAAGGIVWRAGRSGPEVLLVHRPRYDDWTLPKGKAEAGESDRETARREVEEETGRTCRIGGPGPVAETRYLDRHGRGKRVRWFLMTPEAERGAERGTDPVGPTGPPAAPGGSEPPEVDDVRWVGLDDARRMLTYERDRPLLDHVPYH